MSGYQSTIERFFKSAGEFFLVTCCNACDEYAPEYMLIDPEGRFKLFEDLKELEKFISDLTVNRHKMDEISYEGH